MTKTELLKATGNIWRVDCWHDGNRRRIVQTLYIRASDVLAAEAVGRRGAQWVGRYVSKSESGVTVR